MRVLIACEFSGVERDAFIAAGHDAMSCDLLPSLTPGPHYQGDVMDLRNEPFDLVIAHPPCTYLANSGAHWLNKQPERWGLMRESARFFRRMFYFNAFRIAVENPVQHHYAIEAHEMGKPTQYVNPWQFGHREFKKTGLWLVNLPKLVPTSDLLAETKALPIQQSQAMLWRGESKARASLRSMSYPGIAAAMADQWGALDKLSSNVM